MIEAIDLCKTIHGTEVLRQINLRLENGRIYGIKGKNGSGKTMLLRALCGLIRPTSGRIVVDGTPLKPGTFLEDAGVLIENPSFVRSYSGKTNLMELASIRGKIDEDQVVAALSDVGLDSDDERPVRTYSLGMRQRLGLAAALMEHPTTVLLDEPVNALDPAGVARVAQLLARVREGGALIVVACHDAAEIESLFDETFYMAEGALYTADGAPAHQKISFGQALAQPSAAKG